MSEGPGPPEEVQLKNAELVTDDRFCDVLQLHEESNDQAQNYADFESLEPEKTHGYETEIEEKPPTFAELLRGRECESNTSSLIQSDLHPQAIQHQDHSTLTKSLSQIMYENVETEDKFDQKHMLFNEFRQKLIDLCDNYETKCLLCDEHSTESHKTSVLNLIFGCAKPEGEKRVLEMLKKGYFLLPGVTFEHRTQTFYLSDHKELWLEIRTHPNYKPKLVLTLEKHGDIQVGNFEVETSPDSFKDRVVFNKVGKAIHYKKLH